MSNSRFSTKKTLIITAIVTLITTSLPATAEQGSVVNSVKDAINTVINKVTSTNDREIRLAKPTKKNFFSGTQVRASYWLSSANNTEDTYTDEPIFGTPVSILRYNDLDSDQLEIGVRFNFAKQYYLDLSYGSGDVKGGQLIDEDYGSGIVRDYLYGAASDGSDILISKTVHDIKKEDSEIMNIELGRQLYITKNNRWNFDGFIRYQKLEETHASTNYQQLVCELPYDFCYPVGTYAIDPNLAAITNVVSWDSLMLGVAAKTQLTNQLSLKAKFAYVIDSDTTAEDTHHQRGDLRQDPSFLVKTSADGYDLDIELGYAINTSWEVALAYQLIDRSYKRDDKAGVAFGADGTSGGFGAKGDFKRDGLKLSLKYTFN